MKRNINLAIVGHVDHGKSTFIGRLLYDSGYLKKYEIAALQREEGSELDFAHFLDIYKEERENAMTIDTTKRFFETENYQYTIIDSPGHKEFLKNMLSGVSEAQYSVAVVSALENERIQEQTKRHLSLLNLLGVKLLAIVVNKMDLVRYDQKSFFSLVDDLKKFLIYIGYDPDHVTFIPISAKNGENVFKKSDNMNWYRGLTVTELLDLSVVPAVNQASKPLRLIVQHTSADDSVIFGRVESGKLNIGDKLIFEPSNVEGTINSIFLLGNQVKEAFAGDAIGFTFKTDSFSKISRGDVGGTLDNKTLAVKQAIVEIILSFDVNLNVGEELTFRSGTNEIKAVVSKIIKKINSEDLSFVDDNVVSLEEGQIGIIKVSFNKPIVLEKYKESKELGRFVLIKNKKTIPGIVIQTSEIYDYEMKLVCGISPITMKKIDELIKQKRVSMLRVNGAFEIPDLNLVKSYKLPLVLDIPGERKKKRTSKLSDDELIKIAVENNLDYVALSYVKSDEWIKKVREFINSNKSSTKIIAKIETKEAVQNLDPIIKAADMILVDRGDLGSDVGYEKVPFYQDIIIQATKKYGKKIAVATEVAASTINTDRLTYSDVSQIYNFVKNKVDYLVLAEETTINENPVSAVEIINKILDFAEVC